MSIPRKARAYVLCRGRVDQNSFSIQLVMLACGISDCWDELGVDSGGDLAKPDADGIFRGNLDRSILGVRTDA